MARVGRGSSSHLLFVASLASILAGGSEASAVEARECASAYERAQVLRRDSKFRAAREQLSICAQKACPAFIVDDCIEWSRDLETKAPTVIISAKDERGHDLTDVRVAVDGVPLLARLDGQAVAIDPGAHLLRFESDSTDGLESDYVVHPGERNRPIAVRMHTRAPSHADQAAPSPIEDTGASDTSKGSNRAPAIIFGAAGVAGLVGFAYFGLTGHAEVADLRAACAPHCNPSEVDSAKQKLHIADASLGFAALSLGIATWLYLSSEGAHRSPPRAAFDVLPTSSGGIAKVAVTF